MGVIFHDVPKDGPITDGDHRLRDRLRVFPDSHTEAAAKQHNFHCYLLDVSNNCSRHQSSVFVKPTSKEVLACQPNFWRAYSVSATRTCSLGRSGKAPCTGLMRGSIAATSRSAISRVDANEPVPKSI